MLAFFNQKDDAQAAADAYATRTMHAALGSGLADMNAFTEHVTQMADELKRLHKQRQAEREAAQREKNDVEAKWLQRLRMVRVESALRAGFAARDLRAAGRSLKLWAEVVGLLRRESLAQRQQRESTLQLKLRDSGRSELLAERASLGKQAAASAIAAQQLRAALSARSQELERTIVRDTMAFELQAADALRTKKVLDEVKQRRDEAEAAAAATASSLREEVAKTTAEGISKREKAEAAVAKILGAEVAKAEDRERMRAASQAIVIRLAVQHSVLHRFWKTWASVASLLLREAGGALLQLELSKQQQRGAHTRLQAELSAEVAVARVENIESRTLLAKAGALDNLRPGHELATDKELLQEQSRALHAAHESAAAAHMAAAGHRVGEQALLRELGENEALVGEALNQQGGGMMPRRYDPFAQQQETHQAYQLRRAGVEMRVLARALQSLEQEASAPPLPQPGAMMARQAMAPAAAKPRDASPRPAKPPPGKPPAKKKK